MLTYKPCCLFYQLGIFFTAAPLIFEKVLMEFVDWLLQDSSRMPVAGMFIFSSIKAGPGQIATVGTGRFCAFCKRLEQGSFKLPKWESEGMGVEIEYGQLTMIITGFSQKYAKKRRRFKQQNLIEKVGCKRHLVNVLNNCLKSWKEKK